MMTFYDPALAPRTIRALDDDIAALRAENARLRAAIEPLAKIGLWRDMYPDAAPDILTDRRLQGYFSVAEVRAARAALKVDI